MAPSENTWLTWKSPECPNCLRQIMILTLNGGVHDLYKVLIRAKWAQHKNILLIVIKWKGKYVGFWKNRESAKMENMLCKLFHLKVIRVLWGLWAPENNHYQETRPNVKKHVFKSFGYLEKGWQKLGWCKRCLPKSVEMNGNIFCWRLIFTCLEPPCLFSFSSSLRWRKALMSRYILGSRFHSR